MWYGAEASQLILSAGSYARELGHSYVGSIHFLLQFFQFHRIPPCAFLNTVYQIGKILQVTKSPRK